MHEVGGWKSDVVVLQYVSWRHERGRGRKEGGREREDMKEWERGRVRELKRERGEGGMGGERRGWRERKWRKEKDRERVKVRERREGEEQGERKRQGWSRITSWEGEGEWGRKRTYVCTMFVCVYAMCTYTASLHHITRCIHKCIQCALLTFTKEVWYFRVSNNKCSHSLVFP